MDVWFPMSASPASVDAQRSIRRPRIFLHLGILEGTRTLDSFGRRNLQALAVKAFCRPTPHSNNETSYTSKTLHSCCPHRSDWGTCISHMLAIGRLDVSLAAQCAHFSPCFVGIGSRTYAKYDLMQSRLRKRIQYVYHTTKPRKKFNRF